MDRADVTVRPSEDGADKAAMHNKPPLRIMTWEEHLRNRPAMYNGATRPLERLEWLRPQGDHHRSGSDWRFVQEKCTFQPWVLTLVNQLLAEVVDTESARLDIEADTGRITYIFREAVNVSVRKSSCQLKMKDPHTILACIRVFGKEVKCEQGVVSFIPDGTSFGQPALLPGTIRLLERRAMEVAACQSGASSLETYLARYEGASWINVFDEPGFKAWVRAKKTEGTDNTPHLAWVNNGIWTEIKAGYMSTMPEKALTAGATLTLQCGRHMSLLVLTRSRSASSYPNANRWRLRATSSRGSATAFRCHPLDLFVPDVVAVAATRMRRIEVKEKMRAERQRQGEFSGVVTGPTLS
jgi:hypothetical protein